LRAIFEQIKAKNAGEAGAFSEAFQRRDVQKRTANYLLFILIKH
jgi:hypothetical protein